MNCTKMKTENGCAIAGRISLAPQEEHLRLYELLGDAVLFWGDDAVDAYQQAISPQKV